MRRLSPLQIVCLFLSASLPLAACNPAGQEIPGERQEPPVVPLDGMATGENVLVVYNDYADDAYDNDTNGNGTCDGLEVAEYYARARDIPEGNILGLKFKWHGAQFQNILQSSMLGDETSQYSSDRDFPINELRNHLAENDAEGRICYIVLTKGVPLRVLEAAGKVTMSVDMALAVLFDEDIFDPRAHNPYYRADSDYTLDSRFPAYRCENPAARIDYLVTRLDGYTVDEVKGMIDRSAAADRTGERTWILDDHEKRWLDGSGTYYDRLKSAYENLTSRGYRVNPEPWEESNSWVTTNDGPVIGYVSHGWWAGMPSRYITSVLDFELSAGAVFSSYESFNGNDFHSPDLQFQGRIAEWVRIGGSGGVANVAEPYTDTVVDESVFITAYAEGYQLADAAYMGLRYLGWMQVVVGDPLTCISEHCS